MNRIQIINSEKIQLLRKIYRESPNVKEFVLYFANNFEANNCILSWQVDINLWTLPARIIGQKFFAETIYSENKKIFNNLQTINFNILSDKSCILSIDPYLKELIISSEDLNFIVEAFISRILSDYLIERQNFRQEIMISNISHSIKTPLSDILSIIDMVKSESKKPATYLELLTDSANKLANNIIDVIEINKLESNTLEINNISFDLNKLISDTVLIILDMKKNKDITFNVSIEDNLPEFIFGDPKRIRQILINILSNCIRFTKKGEINMFINCNMLSESEKIHLSPYDEYYSIDFIIKDTGLGMTDTIKNSIFKPIDISHKYNNKNISMRASYLLSNLLGGNLELVYSNINAGSCFKLNFICKESAQKISERPIQEEIKYVLLVEDDDITRIYMEKVLKKMKYNVIAVESGEQALNILKNNGMIMDEDGEYHFIDLIITDIQMPNMSGIELAEQLVARIKSRRIKIYAITAKILTPDELKRIKLGNNLLFEYIFYKPIDIKEVESRLKKS
jgi:signal transduction histidine kinase/CheY-like chemotaxis protein